MNKDTVYRDDVIEEMYQWLRRPTTSEEWGELRDVIDRIPTAQPETAKRIVGKSRNGMTLWYQCDMCNEPVDAQDDFCRGCGRRLTDG